MISRPRISRHYREMNVKLPAALIRAARREKVDPARLAEWILHTMDPSLVRESAKFFQILVADEKKR